MTTKAKIVKEKKAPSPKKEKPASAKKRTSKGQKYTSSFQASIIEQLREQLAVTLSEIERVRAETREIQARIENLG